MNGKTYYMILGVSRAESAGGIRAAYRELAKKLHPDVAGQQATHAFQEISEAYDVLSDPQRRREYESELRRVESVDVAPIRPAPSERGCPPHDGHPGQRITNSHSQEDERHAEDQQPLPR